MSVAATRTSGWAKGALALAFTSFVLFPLALFGIAFAVSALRDIRMDPTLRGNGIAVTAIVVSLIAGAVWVVVFSTVGFWCFGLCIGR